MRERDINRQLFNVGHYNVIAGRFKRAFEPYMAISELSEASQGQFHHAQVALCDLMLDMAYRFQADRDDFDPVKFLNSCSPDVEKVPFGELWDGDGYQQYLEVELEK